MMKATGTLGPGLSLHGGHIEADVQADIALIVTIYRTISDVLPVRCHMCRRIFYIWAGNIHLFFGTFLLPHTSLSIPPDGFLIYILE
jgi:hypothetical protein